VSTSWKFQKLSCAMRNRFGFGGSLAPSHGPTGACGPSTTRQKSPQKTWSSIDA